MSCEYEIYDEFAHLKHHRRNCSECSTPCDPAEDAHGIAYSGNDLPCTGIEKCERLDVALQKIEEKICELFNILSSTTTTSSTSTTTSTSTSTTTSTTTINCTLDANIQCY